MKHSFNMENQDNEKEQKPIPIGKIGDAAPKKEVTPQAVTISAEQLAELLEAQKRNNETIIALNKRLDESTKGTSKDDLLSVVKELMGTKNVVDSSKVLDPADWDEIGVSFFYYGLMTVLASDRRKNQEVLPPRGMIVFEHLAGISRESGKDTNILYVAGYTSHSKEEIKWIREHTWYVNGLIGERLNTNTTKKQVMRAQRAAQYLGSINSYSPSRVMQECKNNKIDMSGIETDLQACKAALVEYFVDKEIAAEIQRSERIVSEQSKEVFMKKANPLA